MGLSTDVIRFLTIRVDEHEEDPSAMMRRSDRDDRDGRRGPRRDRDHGPRESNGGPAKSENEPAKSENEPVKKETAGGEESTE